jgi:glycosyltransferase involved in cell wall biosynthesis
MPMRAEPAAAEGPAPKRVRRGARRVLVVIENVPLARDHRARKQVGSLLRAGYDVSVITRRDEGNGGPQHNRLRLYQYPAPREFPGKLSFVYEYLYSLLAASTLALADFLRHGFAVVQTGHPPDLYFVLALPFKLAGRRFVVDQRDLSPEVFAARYGRVTGPLPWLLRALERRSWRLADHVLCVNQSLRRTIVQRGAVPADAVSVVGNGPVLAMTAARAPRPDAKRGRRFLVCWLGLMGPQDSVDLGLRAVHHLVHGLGRDDCHFVFIGDGETLAELQRLAVHLAVADRVTFTGWLDEDACFDYLATADVAMDTNLQPEVSPVKGMEYMAFGVPFVAFDLEETVAMAEDAAVYVPQGDPVALAGAIDELLGDPARRAAMSRVGRRRVEEDLAWDRQSETYLRVFASLLGPAQPAVADGVRPPQVGSPASPVRRLRHTLRTRISEHPTLYLPFARRKYPGPSPEVISSETELVIDGYTRSATTFAVYAFQLVQPRPVRIAHHLHAPAQLIAAAKSGVPALVVIREPEGAILSQLVREPDVELRDALVAYARFYTRLLPWRASFVVGEFDEVTHDFGAVVRRLNERFGTSFTEFTHSERNLAEVFELIEKRPTLSKTLLGFESGVVTLDELRAAGQDLARQAQELGTSDLWVPSGRRDRSKAALRERWLVDDLAELRARAEGVYRRFLADAGPPPRR